MRNYGVPRIRAGAPIEPIRWPAQKSFAVIVAIDFALWCVVAVVAMTLAKLLGAV